MFDANRSVDVDVKLCDNWTMTVRFLQSPAYILNIMNAHLIIIKTNVTEAQSMEMQHGRNVKTWIEYNW